MSFENKSYELSASRSGVRMQFWGITCIGGKAYEQVVDNEIHLTMAALDPKSLDVQVHDRIVTLSVIKDKQIFLVCVLKHGEIYQVNLNLIFNKGDDIKFHINGYGTLHLTGYQLIEPVKSVSDHAYICPIAEVKTKRQKSRSVNSADITASKNKIEIEQEFPAYMKDYGDDDDDDDDDYSLNGQDIESEEESDDDDDDDELDIEEISQNLEDQEEIETSLKSEGSQKRKFDEISQPIKHVKSDSVGNAGTNEKECIEISESDSDAGAMDSSIGNTPMPKKEGTSQNISKERKKMRKRKRLSEISTINKEEQKDASGIQQSPNAKSTPNKQKKNNSVVKLNGGIDYQDVLIGRGPIATKGKVVSIFYVGRLENKTIFDARTPPKKPFSFKLGVPEVIKGLDMSVEGMRAGGQRKVKIPPNMGYGAKGLNSVPPNSTLYFTIELQAVS